MTANPTFLKQHCECSRLPELDAVLRRWIRVLKRYHSEAKDEPWRYGERAQVGFFAAAAWLSDTVALEEWRTEKGLVAAPWKGRCDLWINICDFHIEAKHQWCNVTGDAEQETRAVKQGIEQAITSAGALTCAKRKRLAFVFLSPYFAKGVEGNLSRLLDEWLAHVYSLPHDAIAWYFPTRRGLTSLPDDIIAVGSVLLIKRP